MLLAKLKEFTDRLLGDDQRGKTLREEELQLAAAALLVHATGSTVMSIPRSGASSRV
jgi:hypothetical protein